jgi:hypothetical protein
VTYNGAWSYASFAYASIYRSFNGARGVIQVNQNVGANSLLQNSTAVAYVQGRFEDNGTAWGGVIADSSNTGTVTGSGNTSTRYYSGNHASIDQSFRRATGVINVNQNAGDNSALQNSAAIAAIRYCGPDCLAANLSAVSVSANYGTVAGNQAYSYGSGASASISNSFNGARGVIQVNQNAGANSLLQNSAAIGVITPSK